MAAERERRRLGFAVKALGEKGLKSHDTRRWQSEPSLDVSLGELRKVLAYLEKTGIRMYRISSDFVPYATHPDLPQFHGQIERHAEAVAEVGRTAGEAGVRLSLHPSQYVVLNAQDESIVTKTIADLAVQAELLDALGQNDEAVVVLHVGGAYDDREQSRERFVRNFDRLPEHARRRLVIENDEMIYSIRDCRWIHERTGLRIIFDHQHHRLNSDGFGPTEAARLALDSWPADQTPKMHFSSAKLDTREMKKGKKTVSKPPLLRQHADYIDPWTFADFLATLSDRRFDVMLEAKAKDLALIKLERDLESLGCSDVLYQPTG